MIVMFANGKPLCFRHLSCRDGCIRGFVVNGYWNMVLCINTGIMQAFDAMGKNGDSHVATHTLGQADLRFVRVSHIDDDYNKAIDWAQQHRSLETVVILPSTCEDVVRAISDQPQYS
jgi:hypothetical protein